MMAIKTSLIAGTLLSIVYSLPATASDITFKLYRTYVNRPDLKINVATFDTKGQNPEYNQGNCDIAKALFQNQPGITVTYWCEPNIQRNREE